MTTQTTLPDMLMDAIAVICKSPELSDSAKFLATFNIVSGWTHYESVESYDPGAYAIPKVQWEAICQQLLDLSKNKVDAVNLGLQWMNVGPSAF